METVDYWINRIRSNQNLSQKEFEQLQNVNSTKFFEEKLDINVNGTTYYAYSAICNCELATVWFSQEDLDEITEDVDLD